MASKKAAKKLKKGKKVQPMKNLLREYLGSPGQLPYISR
jgi:hypothetical protein